MAAIAGFTPIGEVAQLVNIGTLAASVVCGEVILMRRSNPKMLSPFRTPQARCRLWSGSAFART